MNRNIKTDVLDVIPEIMMELTCSNFKHFTSEQLNELLQDESFADDIANEVKRYLLRWRE